MSLETKQYITLDFTVPRIKNVRCVEDEKNTRIVNILVTKDGKPYELSSDGLTVYYKIRKPDNKYIYNKVQPNNDGTVTIELTEQAIAVNGVCHSELQVIDNVTQNILSTMPFNIIVEKSVLSNKEIETLIDSSNESDVVNDMISHLIDYENPHQTTKEQVGLGLADNTPDIEKNVNSATKLTTARNINGTSFDGTTDIVTDKWGKERNISLTGDVTGNVTTDGGADIVIETSLKAITNEQIDALFND